MDGWMDGWMDGRNWHMGKDRDNQDVKTTYGSER